MASLCPIKNRERVLKWRETNPDQNRLRNLIYLKRHRAWAKIKIEFLNILFV